MNNPTYNGWSNYATWRINLEIFDEIDLADFFDEKPDLSTTTDWARDYVQSILETSGRGITLDYARAFVSDVNWREIAFHLISSSFYEEE